MAPKTTKPAKGTAPTGRTRPVFDIVPEDVKNEYVRIAPIIARVTEQYSEALEASMAAKQRRDETYAALYMDACADSEKKPSESYLKNFILNTKSYQAVCQKYIEAEGQKSRLMGDLEALRTKKDMLVSLGAHVRLELAASGYGTHDEEGGNSSDDEDDED